VAASNSNYESHKEKLVNAGLEFKTWKKLFRCRLRALEGFKGIERRSRRISGRFDSGFCWDECRESARTGQLFLVKLCLFDSK